MAGDVANAFTRYVSKFSGREVRLIRVGKSVASPFRQISDAIRHSRPYDRIEVESGRYFEALAIIHPVELCSAEDGEPPMIISRGPCLKINTDGPVLVQNFSILAKGATASACQGILIEHGSPIIQNCAISSVYVINDATPQVLHCHIRDSECGHGLSITGGSAGVYLNNDISYHDEQCVYINTKGKPELRQNIISQKKGQKNVAVLISARLYGGCEPIFCENIVRGGGEMTNQVEVDPASVQFPQMLYENNSGGWASLVGVMNGATPFITGNMLCNGVTGFYFKDCNLPREHFCKNRIISCSAWGLVVGKNTSLVSVHNDFQTCGGGIFVSSTASCNVSATESHSVVLKKCDLFSNFHYGILVDRVAVAISECNVFEGSVGIALLGNCTGSTITNNTLTGNRVAAFSVLRRGVAVIEENNIRGCDNSMYGVFVQDGSNVELKSNNIEGTSTSVFVREASCIVAEKNALRQSSVHHVVLTGCSQATLKGNVIEGSSYAAVVVTSQSECNAVGNVMYAGIREGVLVEEKGRAIFERNSMSSFRETMYVKTGGSLQAIGNDLTLGHHGVVVDGEESNAVVNNNHFRGFYAMAVYALDRATVTVNDNSMTEFSAVSIQVGSGATAVIEKNSFTNGSDGAIHVDGFGTQCKVLHCEMEKVAYGVRFTRSSTGIIQENHMRLCELFGVECNSNEPVTVQDNTISAAKVGIDIVSAGDIHDNVIVDSEVGILAHTLANAEVRNHCVSNCTVGIRLMNDTCVKFTDIQIQKPKEFGVVVNGPSAGVTISNVKIEDSGVAGVFVQKGGMCRFEQCVIERSKEDGIRMEQVGAVVFEQCSILEQHRGVKATGAFGTARADGEPRLINCTIDGSFCEEGVLSANKSTLRLELCKISARSPEKGRGVVVQAGGMVLLSQCDVSGCPRVGVIASATSQLMAEHSTVDDCGIGVCFGLEQVRPFSRHTQSATKKSAAFNMCDSVNNVSMSDGTRWKPPTLSQLTIRRCKEAGIWFESCGLGAVNCTTVVECTKGIVLHHGSTVMVDATVVRDSVDCGILLLGRPSSHSVLTHLTISDSGGCGVKVEGGAVDDEEEGEGMEEKTPLTIQNSEVLRNAKGGVVLEACAYFERCTFAHNAEAGVLCKGNFCPVLSACHLTHNAEKNLEAQFGSRPELRDCVVEHAPVGVCVRSVVKMTRCIAQHLGIAVDLCIAEKSSDFSQLSGCVFANNETSVSCVGEACEETWAQIAIEGCAFHDNRGTSVNVHEGPKMLLKACNFEASRECVKLTEGAEVTIEECEFKRNSMGITSFHAASLEVKRSIFTTQTQHAINVMGSSGEAHIVGNSFSGNTTYGIFLFAEGTVVLVNGNSFETDACSIFLRESPQAFVYNNCFHACQTGIVFHGAGLCGNVFGNAFEKNKCGCRCEEDATTYLWRNKFEENSEYGIFVTGGAIPMVVDNSFLCHTAPGSVALCVCGGGIGHFAFNRYTGNACGARLEGTGNATFINNSTFEENDIAIRLKEGALVHVVACTFVSSGSMDIFASGAIERDKCVVAYNSFFSNGSAAVTVEEDAGVTVYRCILCGTEGTGVVHGCRGRGLVLECLFYELACGVRIAESGGGNIRKSSFIRCATAVEVRQLGCGHFDSCNFLARPTSAPVLVSVHQSSTPTFQKCGFFGWSEMLYPLLQSSGGGLVEGSSFVAGDVSVVLESGSQMTLRRNTFLRGVIGVRFNSYSQGQVVQNTFHRHLLAAVNLMDNATGELQENVFAQPPEGGGMLVGLHNVLIEANNVLESPPTRAEKELFDRASLEPNLIAIFAEYLSEAPHWARHAMGETPHASALPLPILTAMSMPETKNEDEEGNKVENAVKEEAVGDATPKEKIRPQVKRVEGSKPVRKGGKRRLSKIFTFPLSDTIVSVPKGVQETLAMWVETHGVTLNVEEEIRPAVPEPMRQICDHDMLRDFSKHFSALAEAQHAKERGNFAKNESNQIRGAVMQKQGQDDSKNASSTHSQNATRGGSRRSSGVKAIVSVKRLFSTESAPCSRFAARTEAQNGLQVKKQAKRKRRRSLPPPLNSCSQRAQPARQPIRGPIDTLAGCLHKCAVESTRKPKKKEIFEKITVDANSATGLAIFREEETQYSSSSVGNGRGKHSGTLSFPLSGVENVSRSVNDDDACIPSGVESLSRISLPLSQRGAFLDTQAVNQLSGAEEFFTKFEDAVPGSNTMWRETASISSRNCSQGPLDLRGASPLESLSGNGVSAECKTDTEWMKMMSRRRDLVAENAHELGAKRPVGDRNLYGRSSSPHTSSSDEQSARLKKDNKEVLYATQINDGDGDDGVQAKRSAPLKESRYGTRRRKDPEEKAADEEEVRSIRKKKKRAEQGFSRTKMNGRKRKKSVGSKNGIANPASTRVSRTGKSHGSLQFSSGTHYPMPLSSPSVPTSGSGGFRGGMDPARAAEALGKSTTEAAPSSAFSPRAKGKVGEVGGSQSGFHLQDGATVAERVPGNLAASPPVKEVDEEKLDLAQSDKTVQYPHNRSHTAAPRSGDEIQGPMALEDNLQPKDAFRTNSVSESKSADFSSDLFQGNAEGGLRSSDSMIPTMVNPPEQRPTTATMPLLEFHEEEHASEQESERKERISVSEEHDEVHLPQIEAPFLRDSQKICNDSTANKSDDIHSNNSMDIYDHEDESCKMGNALEISAVPSLSGKGRALLGVLGETVLQDDAVLQEHVRGASAGPSRRDSLASGGSGVALPSLEDRYIQKETKVTEAAAVATMKVWDEEKDSDDDEEMEDIIAILRWLVQLREHRLLTAERFGKAVDCIRVNTNVPFFLCEGSRAGEAPTLMLRLPRTADEAVTIPLFGSTMNMRRRTQHVEEGKNSSPQSQRRGLGLLRGATETSKEFEEQNLSWLQKMADDEVRVADATRSIQVPAPAFHKVRPPPLSASARPPHGHRQEREGIVMTLGPANESRLCSRSSLQALGVMRVSQNSLQAGVADSIVEPVHGSNGQKTFFTRAFLHNTRHDAMTSFNPAIPKETSPYNKSTRVAAFIALGTKNFMA
ncbi:hypothetical protein MOQ_003161 [Trypanosoma cruzi marinkellei]|uniref:Right handed beta helix domain-containing protein n=1 Tax=Trypanosoma cruzi marinkellei TaxID=85056 RepID=K2N0N3_TRYCR|nr:hypothetical protein MOQ_003161 [Trypanosoma cruzi marinkellei]